MPSSGNRLYALSGDELFAKYDDHTLPKPFSKSDHLEINSLTKLDSAIPYIERLEIPPSAFSNSVGDNLEPFLSDTQMQIVVSNHDYL